MNGTIGYFWHTNQAVDDTKEKEDGGKKKKKIIDLEQYASLCLADNNVRNTLKRNLQKVELFLFCPSFKKHLILSIN